MDASISIRLSAQRRRQLHDLAVRLGMSDSELIRRMIERGLTEEALIRRIAHLRGRLPASPTATDSMSRSVQERNWRA
jgi:hypothetical protein